MKFRRKKLISFPVVARINTYPFCNLKCQACQEIANKNPNETKEIMTTTKYKRIINKIAKNLLLVVLYDEGEPLLNEDLPEIIKHTSDLGISTSISTNLSMELTDGFIFDLVTSGLNRMTISIDGSTQEIYEKYRVGGNLELVKSNLRRLIETKKKYNSRLFIEVQFLDFGFNTHQLNQVRNFSMLAGADKFRSLPTSVSGLESYAAHVGLKLKDRDHLNLGCFDLWCTTHISSNGLMFPCDFGEDNGVPSVGSLFENDFKSLWNGQYMQDMRNSFNKKNTSLKHATCRRCPASNMIPFFLR